MSLSVAQKFESSGKKEELKTSKGIGHVLKLLESINMVEAKGPQHRITFGQKLFYFGLESQIVHNENETDRICDTLYKYISGQELFKEASEINGFQERLVELERVRALYINYILSEPIHTNINDRELPIGNQK